jgi:hypothetical protein
VLAQAETKPAPKKPPLKKKKAPPAPPVANEDASVQPEAPSPAPVPAPGLAEAPPPESPPLLVPSGEVKAKAEEKTKEPPPPASRTVIEANSLTLVQGRSDPGQDETLVPIIEQLGFSASDIGNPVADDLKVFVSAWGRLDPSGENSRLGKAADLDLGFVSGSFADRAVRVTLGRHFTFGGASRATQLDGASAEATLFKGVGLSAFGGLPVIPRFAVANGDAVFGGRLFFRPSIDAQIGASFFELLDHGELARQEAGLDARWAIGPLTLSGFGTLALGEARLAEANLDAELQATNKIWAHVNVGRTAPDLFIPRTSIFSVFAAERRDEVGGGVSYRPGRWRLLGEYHFVVFDQEDATSPRSGHEGLVKATLVPASGSSVGAQGKVLIAPVNGYYEGRLFGLQRFAEAFTVALDLEYFHFQDPINGQKDSYLASLTGAYTFTPGWMVALTGLGSVTPFFERRLEVLAKLVYNFSTRWEVRP